RDPKTTLQEWSQRAYGTTPTYRLVSESGPAHAKSFVSEVQVRAKIATGIGSSKKASEAAAATVLLAQLPVVYGTKQSRRPSLEEVAVPSWRRRETRQAEERSEERRVGG